MSLGPTGDGWSRQVRIESGAGCGVLSLVAGRWSLQQSKLTKRARVLGWAS